jgi:hypothetical protein
VFGAFMNVILEQFPIIRRSWKYREYLASLVRSVRRPPCYGRSLGSAAKRLLGVLCLWLARSFCFGVGRWRSGGRGECFPGQLESRFEDLSVMFRVPHHGRYSRCDQSSVPASAVWTTRNAVRRAAAEIPAL